MNLVIAVTIVSFFTTLASLLVLPLGAALAVSSMSICIFAGAGTFFIFYPEDWIEAFLEGGWSFPASIGCVASATVVIALAGRIAQSVNRPPPTAPHQT